MTPDIDEAFTLLRTTDPVISLTRAETAFLAHAMRAHLHDPEVQEAPIYHAIVEGLIERMDGALVNERSTE